MKGATPTSRVVEAVARKEGVSATELSPPLYEVVDTEALDGLFSEEKRASGTIDLSFEYRGYEITVENDDPVDVDVRRTEQGGTDFHWISGRGAETPD